MYLKICVLILCLFSFFNCDSHNNSQNLPTAENGSIDLTNVSFDEFNILQLAGDWKFDWQIFTLPTHLSGQTTQSHSSFPSHIGQNQFIKIGKRWKEIESGTGFASYQLKLIFPKNATNETYAIRFYQTGGAAMQVYVDGNPSLQLGKVGKNKESMEPTRNSGIVVLPNPNQVVNLLIHISNFHHDDGAFWYEPKLGKFRDIQNQFIRDLTLDSLLSGALFFMAFYHFVLFYFRRTKKLILYFGLFSITTALHSISLNGDILYHLIPNVPYRIAFSLSLIFYLAMPFYLYFLSQLYSNYFSKKIIHI